MRYIFVTGMGRSGTTWFTNLLHGIPGVKAHHEYIDDKWLTVVSRYVCHDNYTIPFLERSKAAIESSHPADATFIDVNNYLRYSVPALRKVFEGCAVFHLVRDPRTAIPSLYLRRGESAAFSLPITAEDGRWLLDADKFERTCWTWVDTTKRLIEDGTELLLFERLLSDYDYLETRFLGPMGLKLSKDEWQAKKEVRVNRTRSKLIRYLHAKLNHKNYVADQLPPYSKWPDARKQAFERICGEIRRQVGYV